MRFNRNSISLVVRAAGGIGLAVVLASSARAITVGKLLHAGDKEVTLVRNDLTFVTACEALERKLDIVIQIDREALARAEVDIERKFSLDVVKQPGFDVLAQLLDKVSPERRTCVVVVLNTEEVGVVRVTAYSKEIDPRDLIFVQKKLP